MSNTSTTLSFFGAAGQVTGSNFLLDTGEAKILIDCGLSQGMHTAGEENWNVFPYDPSAISFLIVTHAHIDHIGRIPKLVKEGFKGKILSTEATKTISYPMLLDSQEILAHDARKHNREILYTEGDIKRTMDLWEGISYNQKRDLADGVSLELLDAGHILGSSMVYLKRGEKSIVFTGDLGGGNSPLLSPAASLPHPNYLVIESVYGDRVRGRDEKRRELLEDIIEDTAARGGTLLIPAFSTERTQDLLFEIRTLMTEKRVPSMPVYVDSPLARTITKSYLASKEYFSESIRVRLEAGEDIFAFPELQFVEDIKESNTVAATAGPKIVIAGSGMSNGGRVHGHEKYIFPDPKSTLLIVGYQSAGSLGRRLLEGERDVVLMGESMRVRSKVEAVYGYSAHLDGEQLLEFVNQATDHLKEVFVVMGEPASSGFLVQRIRDYLSIKAIAPEMGEKAIIDF